MLGGKAVDERRKDVHYDRGGQDELQKAENFELGAGGVLQDRRKRSGDPATWIRTRLILSSALSAASSR